MNNPKLKMILFFIFLNVIFLRCPSSQRISRDEPYQETVKEREEFERNSYPNCMYYGTCSNSHGHPGNTTQPNTQQ